MAVENRIHPLGEAGVRSSLEEVAKKAAEGGRRDDVRRWAVQMLDEARKKGFAASTPRDRARILLEAVQAKLWVPDPVGTEFIQGAHLTACTDPDGQCFHGGDCFPSWTELLTPDGPITIDKIEVGQRIWGLHDWSTVEAVADKGVLPIDSILFAEGKQLYLTREHKVYVVTKDGEEKLSVGALSIGDHLLAPSYGPTGVRGGHKRISSIRHNVDKVHCYDIQTSDHRVYLPEHDVTVSNCDDLTVLLAAAFLGVGLDTLIVGHGYGNDRQIAHVLSAVRFDDKWHYADPSPIGGNSTDYAPLGKCVPFTRERLYSLPNEKMICDEDACLVPGRSFNPASFVEKGYFIGVNGSPPEFGYRMQWLPEDPVRWLGQTESESEQHPTLATKKELSTVEKILLASVIISGVSLGVNLWKMGKGNENVGTSDSE